MESDFYFVVELIFISLHAYHEIHVKALIKSTNNSAEKHRKDVEGKPEIKRSSKARPILLVLIKENAFQDVCWPFSNK